MSRSGEDVRVTTLQSLLNNSSLLTDPRAVNTDFENILDSDEFDYEWRRACVPISMIDTNGLYLDMDRFSAVQRASPERREPIILLARLNSKIQLLDGGHRIQAALAEGRVEIDAVVGIHPEVERNADHDRAIRAQQPRMS